MGHHPLKAWYRGDTAGRCETGVPSRGVGVSLVLRLGAAEAADRYGAGGMAASCPWMVVKTVFRSVPTSVTVPMMTTEMSPAMRPYSIAVTPDSSFTKRRMVWKMD